MANYIHETAIIFPNVKLGNNIHIGAYSVIGAEPEHKAYWDKPHKGVVIGDNTRITTHVTIDAGTVEDTVIGNNCILLAKSHIGHDAILEDNVTVSCGALIGGHTIVGTGANIALGAVIHQNQKIAEGCMIGMNAVVTKKTITEPFKTYVGIPAKTIGDNSKHPNYPEYTINMRDSL